MKINLETNNNIHIIKNQSQEDYAKNIFNKILNLSIDKNSSDIHMEPSSDDLIIRARIDGELINILTLSMEIYPLISRFIKLSSGINITEKRIPQDGRMDMVVEESNIDIRVSTVPTIYGEKLVLRLLNRESFLKDKSELGFSKLAIDKINKIIDKKAGILLVTGPTGSGKTTTVYSILNDLNKTAKNIMTIEDPVEYKMNGINQIQVSNRLGLTFDMGLRAILRQDPDIIMVGEIRDTETAKIAIRAATTGHLVISTMHTNDAISTIERLMEMEIPAYLISSSIIGVISQKLIKKTCEYCGHDIIVKDDLDEEMNMKVAKGCDKCNETGYLGRTVVYEILEMDEDINNCILKQTNSKETRDIAIKNGMITFEDSINFSIINNEDEANNYLAVNN
ncbi:MAG: GspE/PulE family protein [Peptostreptococcaceae bacterium]